MWPLKMLISGTAVTKSFPIKFLNKKKHDVTFFYKIEHLTLPCEHNKLTSQLLSASKGKKKNGQLSHVAVLPNSWKFGCDCILLVQVLSRTLLNFLITAKIRFL
jgi:hypothetical protein